MTYEQAREEAEEIIRKYRVEHNNDPFPYHLDVVYCGIPWSGLSEDSIEVENVVNVFTEYIMLYNTPLAKAMRED